MKVAYKITDDKKGKWQSWECKIDYDFNIYGWGENKEECINNAIIKLDEFIKSLINIKKELKQIIGEDKDE